MVQPDALLVDLMVDNTDDLEVVEVLADDVHSLVVEAVEVGVVDQALNHRIVLKVANAVDDENVDNDDVIDSALELVDISHYY